MEFYNDTKIVNLNSANAILNNGSFKSDVYFKTTGLFKEEAGIDHVSVSISNAQIPYSFYNINVYNNVLKIQYLSTTYTLTLTRGNYNSNTLINEIQAKLVLAGLTDITIALSKITGLLTFTKTTGNFTFLYSGSTLFTVIGFDTTTNYTSSGGILTSVYPMNLLGILKIKITSQEIVTSNYDTGLGGQNSILATIPIESGNFGIILYDNYTNTQSIISNPNLDGFDIQLFGDDNNLINFNGIDWTITMTLNIVRKRKQKQNDLSQIVKPILTLANTVENLNSNLENQNQGISNQDSGQIDNTLENQPIQENDSGNIDAEVDNDLDVLLYNVAP